LPGQPSRPRTESGGYRRDHLRALAQRVEVDAKEIRIMGSKSVLLRTLVAASSVKTAGFGVPSCTEVARPKRFELLTPGFVVMSCRSIFYCRFGDVTELATRRAASRKAIGKYGA
jgi:hypothetical protein